MTTHRRPLSKSERSELSGIVSRATYLGRAALWLALVTAAAYVLWRLNQKTGDFSWWPIPAAVVAFGLYYVGGKGTGGPRLRERVRADLAGGEVEERNYVLSAAVVFPQVEDEGDVCFFSDDGRIYCVSGQRVDQLMAKGFPREQVTEVIAPISGFPFKVYASGEKIAAIKAVKSFDATTLGQEQPGFRQRSIVAVEVPWDQVLAAASQR